jgi:hypothetical protein
MFTATDALISQYQVVVEEGNVTDLVARLAYSFLQGI